MTCNMKRSSSCKASWLQRERSSCYLISWDRKSLSSSSFTLGKYPRSLISTLKPAARPRCCHPIDAGLALFQQAAAFMQACTCFPEQLVSGVLQATLREAKPQTLRCLLPLWRLCRGNCDVRGCRARRPAPRSKAVHTMRLPAVRRPQAHLEKPLAALPSSCCAGPVVLCKIGTQRLDST